MPEELEIARIRRLRQMQTQILKDILKWHQTMIQAIKQVLEERKDEAERS